jgi:hypothetical protein
MLAACLRLREIVLCNQFLAEWFPLYAPEFEAYHHAHSLTNDVRIILDPLLSLTSFSTSWRGYSYLGCNILLLSQYMMYYSLPRLFSVTNGWVHPATLKVSYIVLHGTISCKKLWIGGKQMNLKEPISYP